MYSNSKYTGVYLGRNAGKSAMSSILNAKRSVKIVSPYLSPDYIKKLVNLTKRGVDVTLITSDDLEESKAFHRHGEHFSHRDVIRQKRTTDEKKKQLRKNGMTYSSAAFVISLIFWFLAFTESTASFMTFFVTIGAILLVGSVPAFFIIHNIRIFTYSYYPIIKLRVFSSKRKSEYLIHSKIFVIDDKIAFLGSMNYTYSGFVKSYESSIKMTDYETVKHISKEVDAIFHNKDLGYWNIQEWGRLIYTEPPH